MSIRSAVPSRKTRSTAFAFFEVAVLMSFVIVAGTRYHAVIFQYATEALFLATCAALSAAFRVRVSAYNEQYTLGIGAAFLGFVIPGNYVPAVVLAWVVGITIGNAIASRNLLLGLRIGARSVVLGLTYYSVWRMFLGLPGELFIGISAATFTYFVLGLLLMHFPAIIAGEDPLSLLEYLLMRRVALVIILNVFIVLLATYSAQTFSLLAESGQVNVDLVVVLTLTTAVFSVVALISSGYNARRRLDGVIGAARDLPWPDDHDPLERMRYHAGRTLPSSRIEIRSTPPEIHSEIGVAFTAHDGEQLHLIARRGPDRSPFLNRDYEALSAIARIGQETMRVRKQARSLITEANTDPLTGLLNYRGLQDALATVDLDHAPDSGVAVVYLDLDGFKGVNDRYGHSVGNETLKVFAQRLQDAVRPRDIVARVGGDEFVVVLGGIEDLEHAQLAAQRIVKRCSAPITLGTDVLLVNASSGVSFSEDPRKNVDLLVNDADSQMYSSRGKSVSPDASKGLRSDALSSSECTSSTNDIEQLITERKLHVEYQPIVDTTRQTVVAIEALVRANHPERGAIQASLLVHEARRLGLLDSLTEQVFHQACTDVARLQKVVPDLKNIHINVELSQLESETTRRWITDMCTEHPHIQLTLEITENSLNRATDAGLAGLDVMRAAGIQVALDDFGMGYSMLAMEQFPFDVFKVDRSLIVDINESRKSQQIIRSLERLSHTLDVRMVVEGVETEEDADVLTGLGVQYIQGYYYARPATVEGLLARFTAGQPPFVVENRDNRHVRPASA